MKRIRALGVAAAAGGLLTLGWFTGCDSGGSKAPKPLSKEDAAKAMAKREQDEAKKAAEAESKSTTDTASAAGEAKGEAAKAEAAADAAPGRGTLFVKLMAQPVNEAVQATQDSLQGAVLGGLSGGGGGNRAEQGDAKDEDSAKEESKPAEGEAAPPAESDPK